MSDVVAVAATVATGIATIGLVIYTALLWAEGKKQRETLSRPDVGVYLEPDRLSHNIVYLVIANAGRGSAYNISFTLDPPEAGWTDSARQQRMLKDIRWIGAGMDYLPPAAERRVFFAPANYWKDGPVTLCLDYDRKKEDRLKVPPGQKEFHECFSLDLDQFEGQLFKDEFETKLLQAVKSIQTALRDMDRTVEGAIDSLAASAEKDGREPGRSGSFLGNK